MQCFLRQEKRVITELSSLGLHLVVLADLLSNALSGDLLAEQQY